MKTIVLILAVILAFPAGAQDRSPGPQADGSSTMKVVWTVGNSEPVAVVSADGRVEINWEQVDQVLAQPKPDSVSLAIARLMVAIRDKTYTETKK